MMRVMTVSLTLGAVLTLAGCASDSLLVGMQAQEPTASIASQPAKPVVDPACGPLAAKIQALRNDGIVERVEAASSGKGATVKVKRASLAQIADLEKANAEFQAKCSTLPGGVASAPALPPQATVPAPTATVAASSAAPAKTVAAARPTTIRPMPKE